MRLTGRPPGAWRTMIALVLVVGMALPIWGAPGARAQPALPITAAAAPDSTVLFHAIDLDRNGAQWQQTEALAARVGFPDAIELWEEEVLAEAEQSGEFTEADLDALLGGEMAVVVSPAAVERFVTGHMMGGMGMDHGAGAMADATPAAAPTDSRGVAGILAPGDPDAAWAYVERQLGRLAQRHDVTLEARSEGGADFLWLPPRERSGQNGAGMDLEGMIEDWAGAMYGGHGRHGIAAARAGEFIVAARSQEDVAEVVATIEGDAGSLADAAEFQALAAELPADALTFTYLDEQAIIDALDPAVVEAIQGFLPEVPPDAWGGHAAFAFSADDPGFRFDAITIPGIVDGPGSLLVPNDPAVAAAAQEAPEGTFWFQAGRLPEHAFVGAAYMLAQAVNDEAAGDDGWDDEAMPELRTPEEIDEEIAAATAILGFDPRTDLFDLLGDEYIVFSSFPSFDFDTFGIDFVAAVSTADPTALAETATKIAAAIDRSEPNTDVAIRRIGEDTVYRVSDTDNSEVPALEFGVASGQAVVGVGEGIEQLQANPAPSLADDAQFQTVMGFLPGEYSNVVYIDASQAVAAIMMLTGEMGAATTDADFACAEFADQGEAQTAYDADPATHASLDLDFDGTACEDAFASVAATPMAAVGSPETIRALGVVSFQRDGMAGTSAILYIAEP